MEFKKYKDFNRVAPKPPPRAKTYEYCPKKPEPPPPLEKFCRVQLKKHPSGTTMKYKMLRVCPRVDYRDIQCQPIVICDDDDSNNCKTRPRVRKRQKIDDDDSWMLPIPKPPKCPDPIANPCANEIDPCKTIIRDYDCGSSNPGDD